MTTTLSRDGAVVVLRMDEGRGNALSSATIDVLMKALDDVEALYKAGDAGALVITGRGKSPDKPTFCAGLDLRECQHFDRAQLARYVDAFEGLFERIFSFPLPTVAAVNGHAIAGGAVIAYACDLRVLDPGMDIALNEVELGIPFPSMAFEIGRFSMPSTAHVDGLLLGKRFRGEQALARGVVDEVAVDVEKVAVDRALELTLRGREAVVAVKRMLRAEALQRARANAAASRHLFVNAFLGTEAQRRIRALVDKLEKR